MNGDICKGCGASIIWIKTEAGKNMPCDAKLVAYKQKKGGLEKVVTDEGEVVSAETQIRMEEADGIGHRPHWATCPAREQFKRKAAEA